MNLPSSNSCSWFAAGMSWRPVVAISFEEPVQITDTTPSCCTSSSSEAAASRKKNMARRDFVASMWKIDVGIIMASVEGDPEMAREGGGGARERK